MFDMIRWCAAILVVIHHARSIFYGSYYEISNPTILDTGLFCISMWGNCAVIVFFVLSGYFIGSSVLKAISENRFSWKHYIINRVSRLYIVLIPALIFTALVDYVGMTQWGVDNAYADSANRTIIRWLGNVFMAQPTYVPQYGTITPVWSLSYEFWYYLLFPTLALLLSKNVSLKYCSAMILIAIVIIFFIQLKMASYFLIWMIGVVVAIAPIPEKWKSKKLRYAVICFLVSIGVIGARILEYKLLPSYNHWSFQLCADFVMASLFAVLFYSTKAYSMGGQDFPFSNIHKRLAGFSYTTYLIHNPILVFISAGALVNEGVALGRGRGDILRFMGLVVFVVVCAYIFSIFTERKTGALRRRLRKWLIRSRA